MSDFTMRNASSIGSKKRSRGVSQDPQGGSKKSKTDSSVASQSALVKKVRDTHPFGAAYPSEIVDRVFEFAAGGRPMEGEYLNEPPAEWRLVNKAWNRHTKKIVFSTFSYDHNPGAIGKLYSFLHMVVHHPERAIMVKHLSFTTTEMFYNIGEEYYREVFLYTWKYGDKKFRKARKKAQKAAAEPQTDDEIYNFCAEGYLNDQGKLSETWSKKVITWYNRALYHQNIEWITKAMTRVGYNQAKARNNVDLATEADVLLLNGTHRCGTERPLISLILAHCPNLRNLRFHDWGAQEDPWFNLVLGYAVGRQTALLQLRQPPLQKLKTLHVSPRLLCLARDAPRGYEEFPCSIDEADRPYYRLPQLTELFGHLVTTGDLVSQIPNMSKIPGRIEKLALYAPNFGEVSVDSQGRIKYFPTDIFELNTLLNFTPRLRQLTLRLPKVIPFISDSADEEPRNAMHDAGLYRAMWRAIERFDQQLEYLDIYQDFRDSKEVGAVRLPVPGYCCPLAKFTRLRQLNLPPFLLAGYTCWCATPFKLRSHLPPNLEVLGLYTHGIWGDYKYVKKLRTELANMVSDNTRITGGRSIHTIAYDATCSKARVYTEMRVNAKARGIRLVHSDEDTLMHGGRETAIGWSTDEGMTTDAWKDTNKNLVPECVIPRGMSVLGFVGMNVKGFTAITDVDEPEDEDESDDEEKDESGDENGDGDDGQ
ncbi:hypothetical protein BJX70DRAFT_372240 [Aspergillus crustosus]